ncbi:MAG: ECF transporter S component [Defluviitaleaceae bacterium]|nr:ECF transporter S component [Defluviitaleaceae bacterium]
MHGKTVIMVRAAILGAIATVLWQLRVSLPIFPGFLSLDVSDVPALVGAITTGPLTGLLVLLIKNLLDPLIFGTNTGGIGNLADFIMGASLVVPIGFIFKKRSDTIGYMLGAATGIVSLVVISSIVNYLILIPLYSRIFIPLETIISISHAINHRVVDVYTLILFAFVPFNLLKGGIVVTLGFVLYRALSPIMASLRK